MNDFFKITKRRFFRLTLLLLLGLVCSRANSETAATVHPVHPVTFLFTSDVHYGISRGSFQGAGNVSSAIVNAEMVRKMNAIPSIAFPTDSGIRAGEKVGSIDFVVITGDITNRQELYPAKIQSASDSWHQFVSGFMNGLRLHDATGLATPLFVVPGNHDASNAIGAISKLVPATDPTPMVEMFNRFVAPATPRTKDSYRYASDQIIYARDIGGVHCIFLSLWPEARARAWMEIDLKSVPKETPVLLFCHDPPAADPRHFTNPNGAHDINTTDRFENLLLEVYADGAQPSGEPLVEQRAFAAFLQKHRNITGYFHGHNNWTEFYTWKGPEGNLALHVFRSDSPMKGRDSGKDETKLAFQVITFDLAAGKLTARECRWNPTGQANANAAEVAWGQSETVALRSP